VERKKERCRRRSPGERKTKRKVGRRSLSSGEVVGLPMIHRRVVSGYSCARAFVSSNHVGALWRGRIKLANNVQVEIWEKSIPKIDYIISYY
jgi:hypothetical protein